MSPSAKALRYVHTLRHLRPVQVTNRIARRFRSKAIDRGAPPPLSEPAGTWQAPIDHGVRLGGPAKVTLINRPGDVADAAAWNDRAQPKLWLYNLHYFDWLVGDRAPEHRVWERDLIARWIAENPVGRGNGWEPYPLSLRIVNWVKWLLEGNDPVEGMLASLSYQLRMLERTVEWHLLGNHLLANAKALFIGGALFGGKEGEHWRAAGDRLLHQQWRAQVLSDGGHEERSAMYHAVLLEDVLDCINAARAFGLDRSAPATEGDALAERMLAWLAAMTHPGGSIALFNDAAPGIAATLEELSAYAERLGLAAPKAPDSPLLDLAASGYLRAAAGDAVLLIDAAPVGPAHQPGHAHADTLGFELSISGTPVLVSAGTSTYEIGEQRAWERSTAAHNCVVLGGRNSSDVWAGFRVAHRARVSERTATAGPPTTISASHDGYRNLPGAPIVRREWTLAEGLLVVDDMLVDGRMPATAWLHLAAGVRVDVVGATARLAWPGGEAELVASSELLPHQTTRAAGFGMLERGTSLAWPLAGGRARFELAWKTRVTGA